ncbi:MAG: MFS transporter [Acidimicrobiia bacterium]|nr:MFS transporter [Acidimicrobiia bacterium]
MSSGDRLLTPRFALVVVVGLAYFFSLGMLLPVVPLFVEDALGGGSVAVGVAVGAFSVGAVLLRPFAGRIGDRMGRRILIVGGALTVGVAVALYPLAQSVAVLLPARVLGGIGEAAFFVGAGTMVTDLAPEARRGEAISYWSVAVYGGLAFGPALGEWLLDHDHYSRVWVVSAVLAVFAGLLALATHETMHPPTPGAAAPRQPLLHRAALAPGTVLFLGMVPLAGFAGFIPLYVTDVGLEDSRGVFLLYGCVVLAVRIFGARVPDRIGALRAGTLATGGIAAGMVALAAVPRPWGLYAGTAVLALGMSQLYPSMLMLALTGVPGTERGSAVGTTSSFFDLSQGLGAVLLGGVVAAVGYRGSFVAAAVLAVAGLALLRSGVDPRVRQPVDPAAAEVALENLEPDPP